MMRFSTVELGRLLLAHMGAAIAAGIAFALVRTAMAIGAAPDFGAVALLSYLAAIQTMIVGGAAAIAAVLAMTVIKRARRVVCWAAGALVAVLTALLAEQFNLTFLAPALAAGLVYGDVLFRLAWRKSDDTA